MQTTRKLLFLFAFLASTQFSFSKSTEISDEKMELDENTMNELIAYYQSVDSINKTFNFDSGKIVIGSDLATITTPEGYRYLDGAQTKRVLEELWGNVPQSEPYMGMLFPAGYGPADPNSWAINISYEADGYVEDDDAKDIDYDEMMEEMKASSIEENKQRVELGYDAVEIIGWAQPPFYDAEAHKLHWAKEFKFAGTEDNTLNYNIRILGRRGVINLNAIATMSQLEEVKGNIDDVLASVEFNEGNRYSEFDSSLDEVAAYGIGGLVAGKVLAKAGFFAVLLKFWKVILIGLAGVGAGIKKFFFGGNSEA